jgi:N-acyl-L-homoserine lactone synthetase
LVAIVTGAGDVRHTALIDSMHRDRKRVFVDWLHWNVPVTDGKYEIDQFDTSDAVYLVEACGHRHLASIRLLPTTKPHLMSEVFPVLCAEGVPTGSDVWELTRFCISPDVEKTEAYRLRDLMWTASVEYALTHGIRKLTCATHLQFLSQILAAGWETEPLGLPQVIDGAAVGAVLFRITTATLEESRRRYGFVRSVFERDLQPQAA